MQFLDRAKIIDGCMYLIEKFDRKILTASILVILLDTIKRENFDELLESVDISPIIKIAVHR